MRVTNSMLISNMMNNLNKSLEKMSKYQNQLATNRKITKLSDDPVGVIRGLQARSGLAKTTIYKSNAEDAKSWLTFTESTLMEINEMIKRVNDLTIQASNDTNSPAERQAIAVEIDQIKQQIINSLNSRYGNQHIFGGYNVNKIPLVMDGDILKYNNVDISTLDENSPLFKETIQYEVGSGVNIDVSMNALRVIGTGSDNIIYVLDQLAKKLTLGEAPDEYIDKIKGMQEHVLSLVSEVGGRANRLDFIISRYEADEINYYDVKSKIEDIDQAEVIMYLKMQESVYRSALSVGARVIQPSLVDFLK